MQLEQSTGRDDSAAAIVARFLAQEEARGRGVYRVEGWRGGRLLFVERAPNLVTNVGKDHIVATEFGGGTAVTTWYLGLKLAGSAAAGDTSASHAGWSESSAYTEANRPTWTNAAGATGVRTNSASVAVFTINATITAAGVFLISVNTKGGTTGVLLSVSDFASARALISGDELRVTFTFTQS